MEDKEQAPRGALSANNGRMSGIPRPGGSKIARPASKLRQPQVSTQPSTKFMKADVAGTKKPTAVAGSKSSTTTRKMPGASTSSSAATTRGTVRTTGRPGTASTATTRTGAASTLKKTTATAAGKTVSRRPTSRSAPVSKATSRAISSGSVQGVSPKKAGMPTKKRAAWDYKGRLEDMERLTKALKEQVTSTESQRGTFAEQLKDDHVKLAHLEQLRIRLESQVTLKETQVESVSGEVHRLDSELSELRRQKDQELEDLRTKSAATIGTMEAANIEAVAKLKQEIAGLERQKGEVESDLRGEQATCRALKESVQQLTAEQVAAETRARAEQLRLTTQLGMKDSELAASRSEGERQAEEIARLRTQVQQQADEIAKCEHKIREDESARRKLHNTIQELKGNIRVFARVRPLLGDEKEFENEEYLSFHGAGVNEGKAMNVDGQGKKFEFVFDKVFEGGSSQGSVFEEISQLVQSALDGYNVCIFAYGQTGSGKTFTMEGAHASADDDASKGMIPRSVEQIFASARELGTKGWAYTMSASYMEIYNETIRDLINPNGKKHDIKHTKDGSAYVTDLAHVDVTNCQHVFDILRKAQGSRSVGKTQSNERSSRSHSVFTLRLEGSNHLTGETCDSQLNLVDLAGSERLSSSGASGERLKETQAINKSLSNLGNVIMALSKGDTHIPYRNSKLTHSLQDSLGGNSKTLFFVNINPSPASMNESLCSLRFATKVNSCQIGTAKKTTKL